MLREDPERAHALRSRAIEVATQFTWAGVAQRFLRIFQACLDGASPARSLAQHLPRGNSSQDIPQPQNHTAQWSAAREVGSVAVRCHAPMALTVEVVSVGTATGTRLERTGSGTFAGMLPHWPSDAIVVLLTWKDGSVAWQEMRVEAGSLAERPA